MKRNYATLDGMRGLAAAFIVVLHTPVYFGDFRPTEAFLAVDLFFCLSGFVLAHAYHRRFEDGLSPGRFMLLRLARLYPLYVVGLGLGIVAAIFALRASHSGLTLSDVAISGMFNALFLPSPATGPWGEVFPLNGPCWSLFFELIVNLAMAVFWRRLSDWTLVIVCLVAGICLLTQVILNGNANAGFTWPTITMGLSRVSFSFFLGILIYRKRDRITVSLSPWIVLGLEGLALFYVPDTSARPFYELMWIAAGFPALILLAVRVEPRHAAGVFRFLGLTSYPIYVLHEPLQRIVHGAFLILSHRDLASAAPWGGVVLVTFLLAFAWIMDRIFDRPARRWLTSLSAQGGKNAAP